LQKAREAQAIAEEAITKAQGQITDIETSLDSVRNFLILSLWVQIGWVVIMVLMMVIMRDFGGCRFFGSLLAVYF